MLFLSCLYGCPHRQSYLMMTSYWSMWDPRWLPWRTPPLPTTIHRLQLPSLLSDGGKPCWGREARARARCSSLPWRPRGGDRSQDTRLSCCTNTGMSIRPEEQDRDFRWSRHQRGWQGPDSRAVELLNKISEEDKTIGDVLAVSCPDWWCSKVTAGGLSSPNLWKVGTHRCLEFLSDLLVNIQESEWLRSIQVTTPDWRQDSESLTEGRKKKNKQDLIFTLNTTLNIKKPTDKNRLQGIDLWSFYQQNLCFNTFEVTCWERTAGTPSLSLWTPAAGETQAQASSPLQPQEAVDRRRPQSGSSVSPCCL